MVYAKEISGVDGKVTYPTIGALVGYFAAWKLTSPDPKASTYRLTANFAYLNPKLWDLKDYTRQITLKLGKDKFYRVEQSGASRVELQDKDTTHPRLEMDEVVLVPIEERT